MSELIKSSNIDQVIKKNQEITEEVTSLVLKLQTNNLIMRVASVPQLALLILRGYGLIQLPIEDQYWSGAIYVKDRKIIPVINTALPRANQFLRHGMKYTISYLIQYHLTILLRRIRQWKNERLNISPQRCS